MKNIITFFLFTSSLLISLGSCSTVRVPDSDPTPPEATIVMSRLTQINLESLITHELEDDSNIIIISNGHDPDGGIRNIRIIGDVAVRCFNEMEQLNLGLVETFVSQNPDPNFPPVPDRAKKIRVTIINITPETIAQWKGQCEEGFVFQALEAQFFAEAFNFTGGSDSTGTVSVFMSAPGKK